MNRLPSHQAGGAAAPLSAQLAAAGAGLLFAGGYLAAGLAAPPVARGAPSMILVEALLHLVLLPLFLVVLVRAAAAVLLRWDLGSARDRFWSWQPVTLLVWPAFALAGWKTGFSGALSLAATIAWLLAQVVILAAALSARQREQVMASEHYVAALFFVSGFAALIYQVVWQRILFSAFGVNSESVTAIVSVFMAGLGIGALAGGWIQRVFPGRLLEVFLVLETGIGAYGAASTHLIAAVSPSGAVTMTDLILRVYAALFFPTLLMGATLPVLIAHLQRHFRDIGRTVSLLYAMNTLGSAAAAFATVQLLFVFGGLRSSIAVAVACNFLTAWLLFRAARVLDARNRDGRTGGASAAPPQATGPRQPLPFPLALAAMAGVGFVSLSLEILWFRLLGFLSASRPEVFGMLLAAYLAGIAWGAWHAERESRDDARARALAAQGLMVAALATFATLPLVSWTTALAGKGAGMALGYASAGFVAYCCGRTFPTLIQLGVRDRTSGAATPVSALYFANIVGATFGPLVTGFILLDRFSLAASLALMGAAALVLALALDGPTLWRTRKALTGAAVAVAAAAVALHEPLNAGYLERLQYAMPDAPPFRHVRQDRTGIITVAAARKDIVYGHGIYDGRFNTDPVNNSNGVDRAYMVAALHPEPRRILEIGLSTGSWTRVLASYEPVEEVVVVEIGRSYQSLLPLYPEVASVLSDPKVRLYVDDGRRWLRNHPAETFDLVVMNTTFPWRANATNLLSREFLELVRSHLRPGGVVYYNSLGYDHVPYTAAHVFRHVTRFSTTVAASDRPLDVDTETRRRNLLRFKGPDEQPVFLASEAHLRKLEQLVAAPLPELGPALLARRDLALITDDNLATEFKVRY